MPPGVVTAIFPDAPLPTTALIVVELTTVKDEAAVPPKLTAVAPVKFVPVIFTVVPEPVVTGENEVTVGGAIKINPARDAVPPGVVTDTGPDDPLPSTTALIVVELITLKEKAFVPPNFTDITLLKLVPLITTVAPVPADWGLKDKIVGGGI